VLKYWLSLLSQKSASREVAIPARESSYRKHDLHRCEVKNAEAEYEPLSIDVVR
jgi:hypothetical protein